MYLTIDSFEAYLASIETQELVDEGIYEFILWNKDTESWGLKRVTSEDEMDDYLHTNINESDAGLKELKQKYPSYPIVCLEEDVYTGDNPPESNEETLEDTN